MDEKFGSLPESAVFPWLNLFSGPVCEKIAANSGIPLEKDAAEALKESLSTRLFLLSGHALTAECLGHTEKKSPLAKTLPVLVPDEARREGAREALADLLNRGITAFDAEYPLLRPRMEKVAGLFEAAVGEMLSRIEQNREGISQKFFKGKPITRIRSFSFSGADTHNGGRAAAKIVTDAGTFLYKPHDLRQDLFFFGFAERFFPDTIRVPSCITLHDGADFPDFGFCEFVTNRPASTAEEAKEYYYHLGGFAAITQILGSVDMHFENLLADTVRPIPVDLETCFMPPYRSVNAFGEDTLWKKELAGSVIGNGMFPTRIGDTETSVLIMKGERNVSLPRIDGEARTVYAYLNDYYSGFRDTYRRAEAQRDTIRETLKNAPDFSVRIVVRPTNYYMKATALTTDKTCLNDPTEAERRVSERLVNDPYRLPDSLWTRVRECEHAALFRGDIPYFYTMARSTSLCDPAGTVMENVFRNSPLDSALDRLEHLSERELEFEWQLQREMIERACRPEEGIFAKEPTRKAETSEEVLGRLLRETVTTPSGRSLWFVNLGNTRRICMGAGYYNGLAGMAPVLAACRKLYPNGAFSAEVERQLRNCVEAVEDYISDAERQTKLKYPEFSGNRRNGCAGCIEGLMRLYESIPDDRYVLLAKRAVGLLERWAFENSPDLSRRDGIAGVLEVLCRFADVLSVDDALLRRYADMLMRRKTVKVGEQKLWHPTAKPRPISGLDIGIGGIGLALHMAGTLLDDDGYLLAAEDAFAYERSVFQTDAGGWPDMQKSTVSPERFGGYHSGNAGLGFLWLYLKDAEMLQKAADAAWIAPPVFSDRLLDGNLGTCAFLLEAGKALHRTELTDKAKAMLAECGTRVRHYQDEGFEQVFEPSLFSGDAGYLYLRLRAEFPEDVRCLLAL